ncbi:hypothetical protein [Sinomonas atrocyanea]
MDARTVALPDGNLLRSVLEGGISMDVVSLTVLVIVIAVLLIAARMSIRIVRQYEQGSCSGSAGSSGCGCPGCGSSSRSSTDCPW